MRRHASWIATAVALLCVSSLPGTGLAEDAPTPTTAEPTPAATPERFLQLPAADSPTSPRRVAIVTSGAISLGAYEAGLNWVLLRYLRQQRTAADGAQTPRVPLPNARPMILTAATGASAGNINALLSIGAFCAKTASRAHDPENNLFYGTWLPIGIAELTENYAAEDGLLASTRIRAQSDKAMRKLTEPGAFEPCAVPMGITLTAADPQRSRFGDVEIEHLRSSALIRVKGEDGALQLQPLSSTQAAPCERGSACELEHRLYRAAVGQELALPYDGRTQILDLENLKSVIEASAAVQFVFGAKAVRVCRADGLPGRPCAGGGTERPELFTDGGFFDNTPLGLAIALGSSRHDGQGTHEYVFIDPDAIDPALDDRCAPVGDARRRHPHSLSRLGELLGHLVRGARSYELATVARYFDESGARVRSTRRHHRVFGAYLGHFAAFTSRIFREYDYDAGIADGLTFVAERLCASTDAWHDGVALADCQRVRLQDLFVEARLADPPEGERGGSLVLALLNRMLARKGAQPIRVDGVGELSSEPVLQIADAALQAAAVPGADRKVAATLADQLLGFDGFDDVLAKLDEKGFADAVDECTEVYCSEREKEAVRELTEDAADGVRRWADQLVTRQLAIENGEVSEQYVGGSPKPIDLTLELLSQEKLVAGHRSWNGGSASGLWNLLPYSLAVDGVRGGGDVAYRAHLPLIWPRWLGLVPQAGFWARKQAMDSKHWTAFAHADLLASIKTSRRSLIMPTFELGTQWRVALADGRHELAYVQAGVALLAEKLRFSFIQYADQQALYIGIGDLPGLMMLGF